MRRFGFRKGTLSSVFRVWACCRVLGYPSLEKIEIPMLKDAMTGHPTGCSGADLCNLLTSPSSTTPVLFFHIKQNNCATLAIKQLPYNPMSKNSEGNNYFEVVFLQKP